ncbi:MAG: tetratricopeptide repeat protein [Boseongicola sp.]|nr:tetratricopeptide repeat protein [Boseongicola sp.]MDD9979581.1 tetratricopeptide repeat protein [Boseongicola sp.]
MLNRARFVFIFISIVASASLVSAGDVADCNQGEDVDRRIRGCTNFIAATTNETHLAIAHVNLGIAFNAKNEVESAIEEFGKAINAQPDYYLAYFNRGVAHWQIGKLTKSIEDFDQAIALNPLDPDAFDGRGLAKADFNDFEGAIEDYTKAIELEPTFGAAYHHRALSYGRLGELEPAVADLNKAQELGCLRHGWCPPRGN